MEPVAAMHNEQVRRLFTGRPEEYRRSRHLHRFDKQSTPDPDGKY